MNKQLFSGEIPIRPLPWKRTSGRGKRRYTPAVLREYYYQLYAELVNIGAVPTPKDQLLGISVAFYRKTMVWADTDNLLKAVFDAGQPSKWAQAKDRPFMFDLWDDRQFSKFDDIERILGAKKDTIDITVWEYTEKP